MEDSLCEDSFISNLMPSLQQLASVQAVLPFWHRYFSQFKTVEFPSAYSLDSNHRYKIDLSGLVKSLQTAKSIEKILLKSMHEIYLATAKWVAHFESHDYSWSYSEEWRISDPNPNWCVWNCNGEIDYRKTASNMLSSSELSGEQKFAVLCAYCMEPEIRNFDLSSLSAHIIEKVNFKNDRLVAYWIFSLKNKLHEIADRVSGSLDVKFARKCDNELAFEYFWNRLESEDQIAVAKCRLKPPDDDDQYYSYYCQKRLFSLMSWYQQRRLLAKMPDQIILNFWLEDRSPTLVLWAWKHSKDRMTIKKFARMLKEIFNGRSIYDEEMQLLIDLWDTAPDRLKIMAANAKQMTNVIVKPSLFGKYVDFFDYLNSSFEECTIDLWRKAAEITARKENAWQFLCKFLSFTNVAERRRLMLNNAVEFAVNVRDPQLMNEAIALCLPDPNDQVSFKKKILSSPVMKKHFGKILSCRSGFKEYKRKLGFYSTDPNVTKEFTKLMLQSSFIDRTDFFKDFNCWTEVCEFIDECFIDDSSLASSIKKEYVSNFVSKCELYSFQSGNGKDKDEISEMFKIIEHVYTPEELSAVKQRFIKAARSEITSGDYCFSFFNKDRFCKMVSWCVGDGNAMVKFKKSFHVDNLFDVTMYGINETYNNESVFNDSFLSNLGDFLEWYFADIEEVKKYKLRKLETLDLSELTMFEFMVDPEFEYDCLEMFLSWFYNQDSVSNEVVEEFKAKIKEASKSRC